MWSRRSEGTRSARAVLLAACAILAPRVAAEPAAPIVSYREVLGEVGEVDAGPALQVFADGQVSVHYPRYMKRAGDYQLLLTPGLVAPLVHSLTDKGLLDFDSATNPDSNDHIYTSEERAAIFARLQVVFAAFNYVFTNDDLMFGKVTFKAVAEIQGARDAIPSDNAATAPPTLVVR